METLWESTLPAGDAIRDYERNIPTDHRLRNGQYYTPAPLCDLMLALAAKPAVTQILEPGCGPGSFLVRAFHRLSQLENLSPASCLSRLQGMELDADAAGLAIQQLGALVPGSVPSIAIGDFISPAADELGLFDLIIGNPPYVRQELMAQSEQVDKKVAIAYLSGKYADYLQAYPEQKPLFSQTADLYLWFFLQAATLLKPGGTLAFVTSNSWLNAAFGKAFRQFLTHHFHICFLAESACERWFPDAAINSLILVLEKKETYPNRATLTKGQLTGQPDSVQILRFLKPLSEWFPDNKTLDYWQKLDAKIARLASDPAVDHKLFPAERFAGEFNANWAFYLRAPKVIVELLNAPDLWVRIEQLGQVRYPLKTGINRFFYLSRKQAADWGIEPEYLFPVLRSSRKVKRYRLQASDCDEVLFSCPDSLETLAAKGKKGALAYIRWGETQAAAPRQKRANLVPWPEVPSVRSNRPWYYKKPLAPVDLLCVRFVDQRFFFPLCQGDWMEDQTFYGLTLADPAATQPELVATLLNSTLSYYLLELHGRTNLGEGVLQFARCDMAAFPLPDPALYSEAEKTAIMAAFRKMAERPILPLHEEVLSEDRLILDGLILAPLLKKLDCSEDILTWRNNMATQFEARVRERIALARSGRGRKN